MQQSKSNKSKHVRNLNRLKKNRNGEKHLTNSDKKRKLKRDIKFKRIPEPTNTKKVKVPKE